MALIVKLKDTEIRIGDTVRISQKIREGEKERLQNFEGVVIAIGGNFGEKTVTVRRIAAEGIGVEKSFPADLPNIQGVKVIRRANVRRAKLYYLRQRSGKMALKLKEPSAAGSSRRKRRPKVSRKKGL